MSYTYQNSLSNKLLAVNEVSLGSTNNYLGDFTDANTAVNDYSYDGNGNLIEDKNKGIGSIGYNHLNLPQQISVPAKGNITYNYDASGAKLSKTVTEGSSVKTTLYLGDMVFENDVFLFAGHEEGRLRKAASVSGEANNQNAIWDDAAGNSIDIVNRRVNRPGNFGTTGTNGNYALSITKNTGGIGAGKLLKVMSGDIVYSSVDYFYHNNYADNSSANGLGSILNHIAGVIAGTRSPAGTAVKSANGAAAGNLGADGLFTGLFAPQSPSGGYTYQPKAYMHILLFDEQFKFDAANSYVVQVSAWVQESRQTLYGSASAKKNGYAYIYFSNESNDVVFFDNFNLTHQAGPLLEETHYYPFGLTMGGVSSKAAEKLENKRKFNAGSELNNKEFSDGNGLDWYDTHFRSLDPQTGRWLQIDPKPTDFESPYAAMGNNPILNNDPLGDTLPSGKRIYDKGGMEEYIAITNPNYDGYDKNLTLNLSLSESLYLLGEQALMFVLPAKVGIVAKGADKGEDVSKVVSQETKATAKTRNAPASEGIPNSSKIEAKDATGKTTKYSTYDKDGKLVKQVEAEKGRSRHGINGATKKIPTTNTAPDGTVRPGKLVIKKATIDEIPPGNNKKNNYE